MSSTYPKGAPSVLWNCLSFCLFLALLELVLQLQNQPQAEVLRTALVQDSPGFCKPLMPALSALECGSKPGKASLGRKNHSSSDLMASLRQQAPVIEGVNYLRKDELSGAYLSRIIHVLLFSVVTSCTLLWFGENSPITQRCIKTTCGHMVLPE